MIRRSARGMARGIKAPLSIAALASTVLVVGASPALAEIPLVQVDGWRFSTDGRLNTYLSVAQGNAFPDGQSEVTGAGVTDVATAAGDLRSSRIRNGFMMSILGFTGQKEVSPNFRVTTRVALWMNIAGQRSKNASGLVDPRELYAKIEGNWGSFLAGSHLSLFGRGGILVDLDIAHDYGLGFPCGLKDVSGGGCGMTGFGAPFPGFEPGFFYATPRLGGFEISLGLYDPAAIGNAQLNRTPLPRFEGEAKFEFKDLLRVFGSGFWQVLEGTPSGGMKDLHVNAWGAQAGAMVSAGPVLVGGAAYQGAGFGPITYLEEGIISADSSGVLRNSRGAFGLGALLIDSLHLKVAGGAGTWKIDKTKNDLGPVSSTGTPMNPGLIKQNLGFTAGLYQTTGPVHFALEYFRAQHTWYDRGVASAANPTMPSIVTPKQVVNFVNVGMTVIW
jgi:hypothetical protein